MPWARVDDTLYSHPKWLAATKGARALWTSAMSWSSGQLTGGYVPAHVLRILDGTRADAACLVRVGLWEAAEDGWVFHDWTDRNPDAASAGAVREKQRSGAGLGNHRRWHSGRGVVASGCEWCTDSPTDRWTDRSTDGGSDSESESPVPVPIPRETDVPDSPSGDE